MRSLSNPASEHDLLTIIRQVLGNQTSPHYPVTIGDDAAIRTDPHCSTTVITTDLSVENIHFSLSYMSLQEAGYRAMVANISDCAAMGASPESAYIQLVIPLTATNITKSVTSLYNGFAEACSTWHFPVAGGDISRGTQWIIGITMIGRMEDNRQPLRRNQMQDGDAIYLSGPPGRSAAGLFLLQRYGRENIPPRYQTLSQAHLRPTPQVELGLHLSSTFGIHAAMDCSDGLSKDCMTLCRENDLGMILFTDSSQVPDEMIELSRETGTSWQEWFLHGGEDYELLFTASSAFDPQLCPDTNPIRIGTCSKQYRGLMFDDNSTVKPLPAASFDHFDIT